MGNGRGKKISAMINFFAGAVFLLAAFHPFTGGTGLDFVLVAIGAVFLALGAASWFFPRSVKKP